MNYVLFWRIKPFKSDDLLRFSIVRIFPFGPVIRDSISLSRDNTQNETYKVLMILTYLLYSTLKQDVWGTSPNQIIVILVYEFLSCGYNLTLFENISVFG